MKKVLYVEDSATSQLLMRKYLNAGCELTITPSPVSAVSLACEGTFDLIISDFVFPEGDAIEFIQRVRAVFPATTRPIIVISSTMDDALLDRVIKAGANDGMSKPLNTAAFRALVDRMLSAPYVRTPERSVTSVNCVQWTDRNTFYEYCPELNLQLSGPDRNNVSRQMLAALHAHVAGGGSLGFTTRERLITHLVHVDQPAAVAHLPPLA